MIPPTTNGWHVDPSRERTPDDIRKYVRAEFRENDAGWLLAKREPLR